MDGFRVFPSKVAGRGLLFHADVPGGGKRKKGVVNNISAGNLFVDCKPTTVYIFLFLLLLD